jgi:hypothetical protein
MHLLFNDPPAYTGAEGVDIPLGTLGERYQASGEFDGWGCVNLHDATDPNLPIIGAYAIPEALDESFASGFGTFSVHEVKTDPRNENLAYFSYTQAGSGSLGSAEMGSERSAGSSTKVGTTSGECSRSVMRPSATGTPPRSAVPTRWSC